MAHLIIGIRNQRLAALQAQRVQQKLESLHAGLVIGVEHLSESASSNWLETATLALRTRQVDAVLHHFSELPASLPYDFHLAAITERLEAREALFVRADWRDTAKRLADLPASARVIAAGAHRRAQLVALHPGVQILEAPENAQHLETLASHNADALITDGLSVLLQEGSASNPLWLEPSDFLPAAGQGVLVLQSRVEDHRTNLLLESLNHTATRYATNAERSLLRHLNCGEKDAVAAHASFEVAANETHLVLTGLVAGFNDDGTASLFREEITGGISEGEHLGSLLAEKLLASGALKLLSANRTAQDVLQALDSVSVLYPNAYEPHSDFEASPPAAMETATLPASNLPQPFITGESANEYDLVATTVRKLREQHPLQGQRILMARGNRANPELVQKLEALGAQVVHCPSVKFAAPANWTSLDKMLVHLSWYDWLTFTHPQSVQSLLERLEALGHQRQEIESHRMCAIGETTDKALQNAGLMPDLVLPEFSAESFANEWEATGKRRDALRGKTMLLFTSEKFALEFSNRHPLRAGFDKLGIYIESAESYRRILQATAGWESLDEPFPEFDYALFHQAVSLKNLSSVIEPHSLHEFLAITRIVSLNETAREAIKAANLNLHYKGNDLNPQLLVKWLREDCQ